MRDKMSYHRQQSLLLLSTIKITPVSVFNSGVHSGKQASFEAFNSGSAWYPIGQEHVSGLYPVGMFSGLQMHFSPFQIVIDSQVLFVLHRGVKSEQSSFVKHSTQSSLCQ